MVAWVFCFSELYFFVVCLTYGWRKLWKWAEVRSFAFKNLLNQLVILWGSNGAPSALVKIKSFLMVLPHISTVRTHADPMRNRCSRCIWRYSRSSSIQLSPTRIIRRERLVLGGAKTTPAPGILCISVLGNIPDEIALKALPAAFAVCRYQHQFIVDWNNAIKELQAAALPSASESWAQTRRIAKRVQDNLYHARYGGIVTFDGKVTPSQLREENRKLFGELPPAIQAWAGSPDDLADLFNRSQSDLLQFVKPGFDRAIKEASINQAYTHIKRSFYIMVINHVDNRSLYYHTINRESNKLLIDKMHECFHLLQQIQDKDISGKLYLAISDAVDIAEDHAFDVGAALQAAISEDELTAHDE